MGRTERHRVYNGLLLAGGDVLINLSDNAEGTLLLSKAVLAERSKWFEVLLSERWNMTEASSASEYPSHTLELYFDNDLGVGLLKKETSPIEQGYLVPSGFPAEHLHRWDQCVTDPAILDFLRDLDREHHMYLDDTLLPLRKAFSRRQVQPPTSVDIETSTRYAYDHKSGEATILSHTLHAPSTTTYPRFLTAYMQLLPLDFCANTPSHDQFEGFQVAVEAQIGTQHDNIVQYWQLVWRAFFLAIYGRPIKLPKKLSAVSRVSILANVFTLGRHMMALNIIGSRVQYSLGLVPGIWRLIAQAPDFMACLTLSMGCDDLLYEACKHIAGRLLFTTTAFGSYNSSRGQCDFAGVPNIDLPEQVDKAVYHVYDHMRSELVNRNDCFVHALGHITGVSEVHKVIEPPVFYLAKTKVLGYVNGWKSSKTEDSKDRCKTYYSDDDLRDRFYDEQKGLSLLPHKYPQLYQLSTTNSEQKIVRVLDLHTTCKMFNIDCSAVIEAVRAILTFGSTGELVQSLMRPLELPRECRGWVSSDYVDLNHDLLDSPCLCADLDHYTRHLSKEYSTYAGCSVAIGMTLHLDSWSSQFREGDEERKWSSHKTYKDCLASSKLPIVPASVDELLRAGITCEAIIGTQLNNIDAAGTIVAIEEKNALEWNVEGRDLYLSNALWREGF